ncbi:hypothetical protein VIGAN_06117500 [Vigna angularis var. angularis]|uniref:Uncharacterized protein n=1 Tax=Vigna angularis var. angularis TaxID=157739 RepID=A0A0S3SAX6_PHAAN|nr:hypothetical protein VIGAN_06117500 [Vigna angularis var. angularis]
MCTKITTSEPVCTYSPTCCFQDVLYRAQTLDLSCCTNSPCHAESFQRKKIKLCCWNENHRVTTSFKPPGPTFWMSSSIPCPLQLNVPFLIYGGCCLYSNMSKLCPVKPSISVSLLDQTK